MAIYYLDLVNGSDAADGTSWVNAWKTITSGATAARTAPGDTIRIAKTADPTDTGQDVTFTYQSGLVTLSSAVTANIDRGEEAWTASTDVTCNTSVTRKEGSASASMDIASGFTTGKIAYKAMASTDFSDYQQISLWIHPSIAVAANTLRVDLCSDASGDTPVDSYTIDIALKADQWHALTYNTAGALGSAIQSVALTALLDPGAVVLYLDNIIACKASSAADSITLTSLVGTNEESDSWYAVQSINGTSLRLDNYGDTIPGDSYDRGYSGTTGTYSLWKREAFKSLVPSLLEDIVNEIQEAGTSGNPITYSGGWNTSTTIQDGETYMQGTCDWGRALELNSKDYITIERMGFFRYYVALYAATSDNLILKNVHAVGCSGGIYLAGSESVASIASHSHSHASRAYLLSGAATGVVIRNTLLAGAQNAGIHLTNTASVSLYDCIVRNSADDVKLGLAATASLYRCIVPGDVEVETDCTGSTVFTSRHHNAPGRFKIVQNLSGSGAKGYIQDSITTGLDVTFSHRGVGPCPIIYPLQAGEANATTWSITIPVKANVVQAFSYWAKKSSSTATVALKTEAFDTGSSVIVLNDDRPILTDTWAQYNLVFTPTADGDCTVKFSGIYGGSGEYIGIDDFGFMGY